MSTHVVVDVGDPAVASLSSCLRPFPGGFSLLTETGRLRTFFVRSGALPRTDATDDLGAKAWAGVQLTSANAVELSTPLSQGSFPLDKDIPVDHSWSRDGAVLVVLRRGSFTVYFRGGINECNVFNDNHGTPDMDESAPAKIAIGRAESTCCADGTAVDIAQCTIVGRASLGLAKVYSGRNSFEGKVVACCAVPVADDSGRHRQFAQNADDGYEERPPGCDYLIAVGGTFGIECHRLEKSIVQSHAAEDNNNNNNSASRKTRRLQKTTRAGSLESQQNEKVEPDVGNRPHQDTQEDQTVEDATAAKTTAPEEVPSPPLSTRHWSCRLLTTLFDGYPVVAVDFSPDANIFAAAAMTGHVKVWEVLCLLAVPLPVPTRATAPASKQPVLVGAGGRGKLGQRRKQGQGSQDQSREENAAFLRRNELASVVPTSSIGGCVGPESIWSTVLLHSMPRVTSLSFCPDDNASLALACWDGQVILFQPAILTTGSADAVHVQPVKPSLADAPTASKNNRKADTPGVQSKNGRGRAWKQVSRAKALSTTAVSHLEDQDGAFVCWCCGHGRTPGTDNAGYQTADLAVSSYRIAADNIVIGNHDAIADSHDLFSSFPASPRFTDVVGAAFDPSASTGPGIELFAEGGRGKRSGGVMTGSRSNLPEATAERYLIHGLTSGQNFVALYDSDLCLHVISLGAILEADRVLTPAPSARVSAENSMTLPLANFPDVTRDDKTLPAGTDPNLVRPETNPIAHAENTKASLKGKHDPPRSAASEVTLVNNDHGLVKAEVCRYGVPGEHWASSEEDLGLSITWRDAFTGAETPDGMEGVKGGVGGGHDHGGRDRQRRLSFLPGYVEGDGNESCNEGVIAADVRWWRLALFTRYIVLVYTRPVLEKNDDKSGGTKGDGLAGGKGWKAYPDGPLVHGVLFGGASTATTHLSERLPQPAADLKQLYVISILEGGCTSQEIYENVTSYSVVIRSLSDRRIFCRCNIRMDGNGDVDGDSLVSSNAGMRRQGMKAYVSPGYGGGVFVVAAEGGEAGAEAGEAICARIWRGTFDEGLGRVSITSPTVVTSAPWPAPETLRLQGVAGPNCELVLFKEDVDMVESAADGDADCQEDEVRWWMTWPEKERWRYADAPRTLAGEDLTVSVFCIIFQQLMEAMLTDYNWKPKPEGVPPPTARN